MRKLVCLILVGLVSFASSQTRAESNSGKQEDANKEKKVQKTILVLFEKQVQAWNDGDLDRFMETYWKSPDLTFSSGGNTTRGWKATLDRYKTNYSTREKMGELTFSQFEVTLLGETSALALGRWHLKRSKDELEGNFSVVLRKMKGEWKIIHDHSSSSEKDKD